MEGLRDRDERRCAEPRVPRLGEALATRRAVVRDRVRPVIARALAARLGQPHAPALREVGDAPLLEDRPRLAEHLARAPLTAAGTGAHEDVCARREEEGEVHLTEGRASARCVERAIG